MDISRTSAGRRLAATACATALAVTAAGCGQNGDSGGGAAARYPTRTVQLMVPAAPGGGWDLTARAMQKALKDGGQVKENVEVYNVPGAGGTLGLAQLVTKHRGEPHQIMVMGLVMLGAVVTNKSAVDVTQTTPIATLTAEAEAIVVPANSKYQTLKDLVEDWKANPGAVKWGGGSAGGTDQILVGLLAKAAGIDPKAMKYVGYSGGGETKTGLLSGDLSAAVSGVSEFKDLVAGGKARALAVSGGKGVDAGAGKPAPTIKESGYDVELLNWRGVVAPPGLKDDERKAVVDFVAALHDSPKWKETLQAQGWEDFYKSGDEATAYVTSESARIKTVLADIGLGS